MQSAEIEASPRVPFIGISIAAAGMIMAGLGVYAIFGRLFEQLDLNLLQSGVVGVLSDYYREFRDWALDPWLPIAFRWLHIPWAPWIKDAMAAVSGVGLGIPILGLLPVIKDNRLLKGILLLPGWVRPIYLILMTFGALASIPAFLGFATVLAAWDFYATTGEYLLHVVMVVGLVFAAILPIGAAMGILILFTGNAELSDDPNDRGVELASAPLLLLSSLIASVVLVGGIALFDYAGIQAGWWPPAS